MKQVYVTVIMALLCVPVVAQTKGPDTIPLDQDDQARLETIFLEMFSASLKSIKVTDEFNLLARRFCKPGFSGLGKSPSCEFYPPPKSKNGLAKYKRDLVRADLLIREFRVSGDLYEALVALLESQIKLWNARTAGDYKLDWKNKQLVRLSADETLLTPHDAALRYSSDFLSDLSTQTKAALEKIKQKRPG